MPSHLRREASFGPVDARATYQTSPTLPPAKKQKMSLTQTYYVASTARTKLGREASRPDHDLRLLVGHANLLDNLMVELADAEREQEAWFNESIKTSSKPAEPRHIQWIDSIAEEMDDDDSDDESEDGSFYDEDAEDLFVPTRRLRQSPVEISSAEIDADYESDEESNYDDDEEDGAPLTRVSSRHSPPELTTSDSDSESEEEDSMPPSPENVSLELSEKERAAISTTAFYDNKTQAILEEFFPQQQTAPLIAAC